MERLLHSRVIGRFGLVAKTLQAVCIHGDTREYSVVLVSFAFGCTFQGPVMGGGSGPEPPTTNTTDTVHDVHVPGLKTKLTSEAGNSLCYRSWFGRMKVNNYLNQGILTYMFPEVSLPDQFYWPGVNAKVNRYCASCPTCQRTAPESHYRNPQVSLLITEVTFECNYCKYPEVVP